MTTLQRIEGFTEEINKSNSLSAQAVSWAYEAALLKTCVAFEHLMLECIVTAINNDSSTISAQTDIAFPRHLNHAVCEYLVTGGRFFDFRGRDGLIQKIKGYVPDGHWLLEAIKQRKYKDPLDRMIALRNFAAHESPASKRKALEAIEQKRVQSAGSWVKHNDRFLALTRALAALADDIKAKAPY